MLMARPASHHCGLQRQLPGNLRAIEPAQRRGDIGQQRRGDQVAADQAHRARGQRQRHQFDQQHGVQQARGYAAGAQGPQHRQALLEGKADRRIDDEQPDDKGQQAERGQVEVKTVGEAFEIALRIGRDQAELSPTTLSSGARGPLALPISRRETRSGMSSSCCAMPISTTSTPGTSCGWTRERRQRHAAARRRRGAFRQVEIGQRFRRHQGFARRRQERLQTGFPDRGRIADFEAGSVTGSMPNSRRLRPPI